MKLKPPCSYQGGKIRLAPDIIDIIFKECKIDNNTIFYDLCCGSGAFSVELINKGINPKNIVMIDAGCMGAFYEMVSKNKFNLDNFEKTIKNIPSTENICQHLTNLSKNEPKENYIYDYLIMQAGAFGSKQIWIDNNKWMNCSFREYWKPTQNSKRKTPVNPMMPMPEELFIRVKNIVEIMGGKITAHHGYVQNYFDWYFNYDSPKNAVVYLDPPYKGRSNYKYNIDITDVIANIWNDIPIFISEGYDIEKSEKSWLLSEGRTKGNMNGNTNKKPTEEWLNLFR